MTKIYNKLLLGFWAAISVHVAVAQQSKKDTALSKVVVVENEYRPKINVADKVHFTPEPEVVSTPKQTIDYLNTPQLFGGSVFTPASDYSVTEHIKRENPFYARLGYGSRNNFDARLSFAGMIGKGEKNYLQAGLYAYGMNGKLDVISSETGLTDDKWNTHFYRLGGDIAYKRYLKMFNLYFGGEAKLNSVGFLPGMSIDRIDQTVADNMNTNSLRGYVGMESNKEFEPFQYRITAGTNVFNYLTKTERSFKGHEMDIFAHGYVGKNINESQLLQINYRTDVLLNNMYLINERPYENYALLQFNPYYGITNDKIRLRLGVHSDWQLGWKSKLILSPDVRFDWLFASNYQFFIAADGGSILNNASHLSELSLYGMTNEQLDLTYMPYDFSAGIKARLIPQIGIKLSVHYTAYKNYTSLLPSDGRLINSQSWNYSYVEFKQHDVNALKLHAGIDYLWKDKLQVSAEGNWYRWEHKDVDNVLFLHPLWNVKLNARAKLVQGLSGIIDYEYEKRVHTNIGYYTPAINSLNIGAEYNGMKNLTVYAKLNNLLNRRYFSEYGYPVQRFYMIGGISIRF